jgi:small-conductance mechanosensitive channel
VYGTKSDLLFTIFSELREAGINLSVPQNLILQRPSFTRRTPDEGGELPAIDDGPQPKPQP